MHESAGAVLGHRRLVILDPKGGLQPFASSVDASVITYNGELYGFDALRGRLAAQAPFVSRSDTEVILRQLTAAGARGLDEINGMYGFAFIDGARDTLMLAVDPVGIKPLYGAIRGEWVAFASELGAMCTLLERMGEQPSVSAQAIEAYLERGWIDAPSCALADVFKLRPGEVVCIARDGGTTRHVRPLPAADSSLAVLDDGAILSRARDVLEAAVRDQLIADVPVGLFLSGGLDSSLLLALAVAQQPDMRTFSIGFRNLETDAHLYDETDRARRIATHFRTKHHELQLTAARVFERLDEITLAVDEPLADPAAIPLFFLSEFASRDVKAVLTGDGGDELFGGYQHHRVRLLKGAVHGMPEPLRSAAVASMRLASRALTALGAPGRRVGAGLRLIAEHGIAPHLFPPDEAARACGIAAPNRSPELAWGDSDAVFLADMSGPLAGGMLQKTDRITMRHGLEARVPLLDDRVLRFARGVPWRWKVRSGNTKVLLRRLLKEVVPADIAEAPKRGFRVPLGQWFRGPLAPWIGEWLGERSAIGTSMLGTVARGLLADHRRNACDHGQRLWALAVLEPWLRRTGGRVRPG